jgi:hypothetical protein
MIVYNIGSLIRLQPPFLGLIPLTVPRDALMFVTPVTHLELVTVRPELSDLVTIRRSKVQNL